MAHRHMDEIERDDSKKRQREAILVLLQQVKHVDELSGTRDELVFQVTETSREIRKFLDNEELSGELSGDIRHKLQTATDRFEHATTRPGIWNLLTNRNRQVSAACIELQNVLEGARNSHSHNPRQSPNLSWRNAAPFMGAGVVVLLIGMVFAFLDDIDPRSTSRDDIPVAGSRDDIPGLDDTILGADDFDDDEVVDGSGDDAGGIPVAPLPAATATLTPEVRRFFVMRDGQIEQFDLFTSVEHSVNPADGLGSDEISEAPGVLLFALREGVVLANGEDFMSYSARDIIEAHAETSGLIGYHSVVSITPLDDFTLEVTMVEPGHIMDFLQALSEIRVATRTEP